MSHKRITSSLPSTKHSMVGPVLAAPCTMATVGIHTYQRRSDSSPIASSASHQPASLATTHQRRDLSQNGHAWLGSLRYGFPFSPQLGSFALQYGKLKATSEPSAVDSDGQQDGGSLSQATSKTAVKMMRRPEKDLSELDIADDAGLKFSFSHSASIRGAKGDARVADMIIKRRQVATKALLRLKVLEMSSCARGDVHALFRDLTKDFERERRDVIDSFWARIPEDNMDWEGGGGSGRHHAATADTGDPSTTTSSSSPQVQTPANELILRDVLAAIDLDQFYCRKREEEHLNRINEVEASLLEMLQNTPSDSLPASTCHLLRYLDSTRERVELIFSKKIDNVVQLFVLYHQKRVAHDAGRLGSSSTTSSPTEADPEIVHALAQNPFEPAPVQPPKPDSASANGGTSSSTNDLTVPGPMQGCRNKNDSTEACMTEYNLDGTVKGPPTANRKAPPPRVTVTTTSTSATSSFPFEDGQVVYSGPNRAMEEHISGEDLIRDQQRRIYHRSFSEEAGQEEEGSAAGEGADGGLPTGGGSSRPNEWAERQREREEGWRRLDERMSTAAPSTSPVSEDALTGSLFLSAAAELGAVEAVSGAELVREGVVGATSTTEEAEEEEDESGGRRGTSELDELVLQDALIYSRALVFASGGGRSARDWIAGAGTLAAGNPALVRIALQHHGTLRDLQMFVTLCEVTSCTSESLMERVNALCDEAEASGDSRAAACVRRRALDFGDTNSWGAAFSAEAEVLSPTSLLAEEVIFKEERRAAREQLLHEQQSADATVPDASREMATGGPHPPSSFSTVSTSEEHQQQSYAAALKEYFYARSPYVGSVDMGPTTVGASTSSADDDSPLPTDQSSTQSAIAAAIRRSGLFKNTLNNGSTSMHLDLEFGDHSDFNPKGAGGASSSTSTSAGPGRSLGRATGAATTGRWQADDDQPLVVELPVPFTPSEQVGILKRCLVYDSLCAACFMQPQWSLRNTRTLNVDPNEEGAISSAAIDEMESLPGSVAVGDGELYEADTYMDADNASAATAEDGKSSERRRFVYTDDEGGETHNESRILGRHPMAVASGITDDDDDIDSATLSTLNEGIPYEATKSSAAQEVTVGGATQDGPVGHRDPWLSHSLYRRYFLNSGPAIDANPLSQDNPLIHPTKLTCGGSANDRHVRRALACARRLEVDPSVVAELLAVVLEEESIVRAKQRVVGDLGGNGEDSPEA